MKIASYICDACGAAINNPHSVKMREFSFGAVRYAHGLKMIYKKKVHLCDDCFHGLKAIAQDCD